MCLALSAGCATGQTCIEPVNERCDGAVEFVFADLPVRFEGPLGCENHMVDRPYFDLFYRYDCTVTGDYRFDLCGSLGDTYMRVYTGGCGFFPASDWVEDDDSCQGDGNPLDPMITTRLQAGISYWVEIGSWRVAPQFPPNANDPFILNVDYAGLCAADLNIDGLADLTDVNLYLALFLQGDASADLNGDGAINFFDVAEFLGVFANDC